MAHSHLPHTGVHTCQKQCRAPAASTAQLKGHNALLTSVLCVLPVFLQSGRCWIMVSCPWHRWLAKQGRWRSPRNPGGPSSCWGMAWCMWQQHPTGLPAPCLLKATRTTRSALQQQGLAGAMPAHGNPLMTARRLPAQVEQGLHAIRSPCAALPTCPASLTDPPWRLEGNLAPYVPCTRCASPTDHLGLTHT